MSNANKQDAEIRCAAGKFLNFQLGGEFYGLDLSRVKEIIGIMKVTRVPNSPPFVRGVINLRGKVIPVIDLRIKFDMERRDDTERTCIIVMQTDNGAGQMLTTGIVVDEVCEVLDITADQIEPAPELGSEVSAEMIMGIGKVARKVLLLLNIEAVLAFGRAHE